MQPKHNNNLDILRGIAALTVVLFHLENYRSDFDKKFSFGELLNYNFPGHMAVLIFFILSGYVIGINTPALSNKMEIGKYVKKRLVRILPIYFIAIFFAVAIAPEKYTLSKILSNLLFISVPLDNVLAEDGPIWSLNYELLYYFAFIFFSWFNVSLSKTVKITMGIIAVIFVFFHNIKIHPLPLSYFIGFIFWITGAMIAKRNTWLKWEISNSRILAVFMLIFCLQPLNPYGPILKVLHVPVADYSSYSMFQKSISYTDIFFYPLAILLIFSLTHIYSKYNRVLLYCIFGFPALRFIMLCYTYGWDFIIKEHYIIPSLLMIFSILLWILNFQFPGKIKNAIKSTSAMSNISYAMYIIHLPLIMLFGIVPAATVFYYVVKLLAYFIILFFVSYFLEDIYQPYIKKLFFRKKNNPAVPV